jgi:hypothetical protein
MTSGHRRRGARLGCSAVLVAAALGLGCGRANDATSLGGLDVPDAATASATADAGSSPGEPYATCGADRVVHGSVTIFTGAALDALNGCQRVEGALDLHLFPGIDEGPLSELKTVTGPLSISGSDAVDENALEGFRALEVAGGLSLDGLEVTDLSPLAALHTILSAPPAGESSDWQSPNGALEISSCSRLTSLNGLDALEHVDSITLHEDRALTSLSGLPRVRELDHGLVIDGCPLADLSGAAGLDPTTLDLSRTPLTNLSGLGSPPGLERLVLRDNDALVDLAGLGAPARLEAVRLERNPRLESLRGLEALREVGTLTVSTEEPEASSFVSFAGLEGLALAKEIFISGQSQLEHFTGLEGLREVDTFQVQLDAALVDLVGLSGLRTVRYLNLSQLPRLTTLSGLGAVTLDTLEIGDAAVRDLRGLEQATIVRMLSLLGLELDSLAGVPLLTPTATLYVYDSPAFGDLAALAPLTDVGSIALVRTGITDLNSLANLRRVEVVQLWENPLLEQVDALGALEGFTTLSLVGSPSLRSLPSFENVASGCLSCPGLSVDISGLAALTTLGPWPWLEHAESVTINGNPALTSIVLPDLKSASGLWITGNARLGALDLSGLAQTYRVEIRGNGALDDAALAPLRGLAPPEATKILSNLGGPARLDPCPWQNDGLCDESGGDCAPGTDASSDCP